MVAPDPLYLFRITHVRNVPHDLQHGLWTGSAPKANPDFLPIGDSEIISSRTDMPVKVPPGGAISEYIPFYFGARSPMLYVIKNGYNFVKKMPQSDIVYLVVPFERIQSYNLSWFFTDGNARDFSSRHYHKVEDLIHLDWEAIGSQDWANRPEDMDRKRRKQSEFLVKDHLPAACLSHIIVYDENTANFVRQHVQQNGLNIKVAVSQNHYF